MIFRNEYISRGVGSDFSLCPHPVSLVELRDQIVIISEIVKSFYECYDKTFVRADDRNM